MACIGRVTKHMITSKKQVRLNTFGRNADQVTVTKPEPDVSNWVWQLHKRDRALNSVSAFVSVLSIQFQVGTYFGTL